MSRLTRISILLAFFFGLDKIVAFVRSVLTARQFGLSQELDAFHVANNVPDLLFALISGGALAIAFIPVLSEVLTKEGRQRAWDLFSRIANLAFVATAVLALVVAVLAGPLVRSQIGIAPGFSPQQQQLVIDLMRLNLVATLIFSLSGLVMAALQANQHFLLPAMAPLLYNLGQIFGVLILAPDQGYSFGPIALPAFGLGVRGLVYGVILGALLHLGIQIPGLIRYKFRWSPVLDVTSTPVRKVLALIGPRLLTMFTIQLVAIFRDNLASRLEQGSVATLTYGWMIMQVPETLIGTAIGIALLPTLAEMAAREDLPAFRATIQRAVAVITALTIPIAVLLSLGLGPLLAAAFDFGAAGNTLMLWVTRGFLAGLVGHCLLEVAVRSFYARQDAITPLKTAALNLVVFVVLGLFLFRWLGAPGISLADSLAYTSQAVLLLVVLARRLSSRIGPGSALLHAALAAAAGGAVTLAVRALPPAASQPLVFGVIALAAGSVVALPILWREIRLLLRL